MSSDYESLTNFIHENILSAGLEVNYLSNPRSASSVMVRRFEHLGWTLVDLSEPNSRFPRRRLVSPNGNIQLQMVGAKIYRHTKHTEEICRRKHLTKRVLDFDGVPTPRGADFGAGEKEIARIFFDKMPKPVVIKPTDAGSSEGVSVGVLDRTAFDAAWEYALAEGRKQSNVLIEELVRGVELRAYVIGSSVVSVVARIQPYVKGNGAATVEQLIDEVHMLRKVNHRANRMPMVVNWEFVWRNGHRENSIPENDEIVFLNPLTIPLVGASVVDVTASVSDEIKAMALQAKDAVPWFGNCRRRLVSTGFDGR